uniref:Delta(24)-sterol reductase n=1 Tax=Globodera pallida TaxID=36090 RepID=A0A183BL25_GLOPA
MRHSIVFWHSLFLVSLILFISLITFFRRSQWRHKERPNNSSLASQPIDEEFKEGRDQFAHRMVYSFKVRLELAWEVHWDGEALINFQVTFTGRPASILIGFSDHGKVDGWVDKRWKLRRDIHQDCELTNSRNNQFEFSRRLVTCDPRDYRIEKGTSNILLAIGTRKRLKSLRDPNAAHQIRFTQLLADNDGGDLTEVSDQMANLHTLEIRAENVLIPARVTTYWCAIVELGEALKRSKHHVIKYEAVISPGNVQFVHHFEVFHCQQMTRPFAGDCSEDKPSEASSCSKVLAAWAMGANQIVYPPEAGMPLGGTGFVPFLMVEIHYNNEQKLPNNGIFIFASQLHAHLTGRKLFTSVIRDGKKVAELNRDDHYSPHWQHIQPLRPYVHVQTVGNKGAGRLLVKEHPPGRCARDHLCVRDAGTETLDGGYGIEDEMCVNYVHYYPAAEVEVCKSAVSNASLHAFFARLCDFPRFAFYFFVSPLRGVKDKRLKIHEKYSAVRWTKAKLDSLRELFAVAPLNVACLRHSGELFPGHPTNWSRVPRPEYAVEPSGSNSAEYWLSLGLRLGIRRHPRKVLAIQRQVQKWYKMNERKMMCTEGEANCQKMCFSRPRYKRSCFRVKMGALRDIIEINPSRGFVRAEPAVTISQLLDALLPLGLTLPVVPEIGHLTVGGLVLGGGVGSGGARHGLFQHICMAFEVVTVGGEVLIAEKEGENQSLFYGIPWSLGSLGFLVSATLQTVQCPAFVKLTYQPCLSQKELAGRLLEQSLPKTGNHFVEAIQFDLNNSVLICAKFADQLPKNDLRALNRLGQWYKPFFYKHAQQVLARGATKVEYMPSGDYFRRHWRPLFWEIEAIVPLNFLVPTKSIPKLITSLHEQFNTYPLWLCPVSLPAQPGLLRNRQGLNTIYVNVGVYGRCQAASPTYSEEKGFAEEREKMRAVEAMVRELQGFQMLCADSHQTAAEFWDMFDATLYDWLRAKYDCKCAFPNVYDKVCMSNREL